MTTTPNPTAEEVLRKAGLVRRAAPAFYKDEPSEIMQGTLSQAVGVLRAHGLLSEGTPSEAQVEAAAEAIHNLMQGDPSFKDSGRKREMRIYARAALVAAQGAARPVNGFDTTAERVKTGADSLHVAPQAPSGVTNANGHSWMSWNESGKNGTYCRFCGGWVGKVGNRQCSPAPVLPSSGVDVETLANLIHSTSVAHFGGLDPRVAPIIARAVAEWLKGQGRGSEM